MSTAATPAISVVIPLFNKERSVARCLQSVLAQTHPPAEIIIVNDGSTDGSVQVVKAIHDSRLVICDQPNAGVSAARNFGLARASHDFVALLDADDEWRPDYLEKMARLIRAFPDAGLFYSAHIDFFSAVKQPTTVVLTLPPDFAGCVDIFAFSTGEGPCSSTTVLRKSLLEKTGLFDSRLRRGEDIDLWIRFALQAPVALFNAPLSVCYVDAENRAMNRPCDPQHCLISNLDRYADAAQKNPSFARYLQRMRLAHLCNFLGGKHCEMADPQREIDGLDLCALPFAWKIIKKTPRPLRWLVFKILVHARRVLPAIKL
jgi:glycosyltransferase involved in cell wall biosynthesis